MSEPSAGSRVYPPPQSLAERRLPVLVSFLQPFRVVEREEVGSWAASIDQVNSRSWDYVKLHEIVGGLDVGLKTPFHMVVGLDGALALPILPEFRRVEKAMETYNCTLAAVLLGGIYCEAIGLRDVVRGFVYDWRYILLLPAASGDRNGFQSLFHDAIRTRWASPTQAISLVSPRCLEFARLYRAHQEGSDLLRQLPELTPEYLLTGVSAFAHRDWSAVLSNLAISLEQITSHLWKREVIWDSELRRISGRKEQLEDARTWTAAARQELLHQKDVIDRDTLAALFAARQARNHLVHRGQAPDEKAAKAALVALQGLLEKAAFARPVPLFRVNLNDHALMEPFARAESKRKPTHFMTIPELPGEGEINREIERRAQPDNEF